MDTKTLFEARTAHYRPANRGMTPYYYYTTRLPFTLSTVEVMRRDPQVKLGMRMLKAPLTKAKFVITSKSGKEVQDFAAEMFKRIWSRSIDDILDGIFYTRIGLENVYCKEEGRICFEAMRSIHPMDMKILTRNGLKWGIKVCNNGEDSTGEDIILEGPKSFLYIHDREFSSWQGRSELEAAYPPWLDKNDRFGALAIRKLWFYKNAFGGGILFHPPGNYKFSVGGVAQEIPYRDLARQAIEQAMTGAVWTFDNIVNEKGVRLWEYMQPQVNGSAGELLKYPQELDVEILRGMGIPDDVISQVSGTGSFAGRTIPLQCFFISLNEILKRIANDVKTQVVDFLVRTNFGASASYDVEAEVNLDAMMPASPDRENVNPKQITPVEAPELADA